MKRIAYLSIVAAVVVILVGCSSPQDRAQKLVNAGRYEEVIAKYGHEPKAAAAVQEAKDKIAERWNIEGRYQAVVDSFPTSPAAREARIHLADQLLQQRRFQEVADKYPDTPAAAQARVELARLNDTTATDRGAVEEPAGSTSRVGTGGTASSKDAAAQAEYQRIMTIKMKDVRLKALEEFVADPRYAGTDAQRQAVQVLNRK